MTDGMKFDDGKPLPNLVLGEFLAPLMEMVYVGTFGAKKYEPGNFKNVEGGEDRYPEAALRHWAAHRMGELFDSQSGEYHLAHEIWNKCEQLRRILADRPEYEARIFDPDADEPDWTPWLPEWDARLAIWQLMSDGHHSIEVEKREVVKEDIEVCCAYNPVNDTWLTQFKGCCGIYNPVNDTWLTNLGAWDRDRTIARTFDDVDSASKLFSTFNIVDQQVCRVQAIPDLGDGDDGKGDYYIVNRITGTYYVCGQDDETAWTPHKNKCLGFAKLRHAIAEMRAMPFELPACPLMVRSFGEPDEFWVIPMGSRYADPDCDRVSSIKHAAQFATFADASKFMSLHNLPAVQHHPSFIIPAKEK